VEVFDPASTRVFTVSSNLLPVITVGGQHRIHHVQQLIILCCLVGCPGFLCLTTCYLVTTRSLLSVVTETSVYLVVAHQRTSGSVSTIPAFRRHVTISILKNTGECLISFSTSHRGTIITSQQRKGLRTERPWFFSRYGLWCLSPHHPPQIHLGGRLPNFSVGTRHTTPEERKHHGREADPSYSL
jgi:hypothetical protein